MAALRSLNFALLFLFAFISLNFYVIPIRALNVGVDAGAGISLVLPPFLRYGKYCGILYTGCPGEKPCDGLDACCMQHDVCILNNGNDYLSEHCNKNFLACVTKFKKSKAKTFKGNTCKVDEVVNIITDVMDAAIIAGRIFKKP
nr:phospholipase A2-alpha-like [Ipomoea trifida]